MVNMTNLLIALAIDLLIGDPEFIYHPVEFMGSIIKKQELFIRKKVSKKYYKLSGLIISIMNIIISYFLVFNILFILNKNSNNIIYNMLEIYLIYSCIATRQLSKEANKIYKLLLSSSIPEARRKLNYIVGRDTLNLEEEDIIKATVETVAENTSDGVIAPLFYIMILGAPGGVAYKFINTMDSMLGYKNDRYIDLGKYPALIDDLFNLIPSRLTSICMLMLGGLFYDFKNGMIITIRDRYNHDSPNSGYPESSVSGLLNIQLGGDAYYNGKRVSKPRIGDDNKNISKDNIKDSIYIMYLSQTLIVLVYILIYK